MVCLVRALWFLLYVEVDEPKAQGFPLCALLIGRVRSSTALMVLTTFFHVFPWLCILCIINDEGRLDPSKISESLLTF